MFHQIVFPDIVQFLNTVMSGSTYFTAYLSVFNYTMYYLQKCWYVMFLDICYAASFHH